MDGDLYDGIEFEPDTELAFAALLSEDERVLLDAYRSLNDGGRQSVWAMVQFLFRLRREGVSDGA